MIPKEYKFKQEDLLNALFIETKETHNFIEKSVVTCLQGQLEKTRTETPFLVTFFRIHFLIKSLIKLNSSKDVQSLTAIARTSFELLIDLKILEEDKVGNSIEKYHYFRDVLILRRAKNLVEFFAKTKRRAEDHGHKIFADWLSTPGRIESIDETLMKHWGSLDVKRNKHWSAIDNIRERASLFGVSYEQLYVENNLILNFYIHAGSSGFFGFDEAGITSTYWQAVTLANQMYLEAIQIIIKKFELYKGFPNIREDLEKVKKISYAVLEQTYKNELEKKKEAQVKVVRHDL